MTEGSRNKYRLRGDHMVRDHILRDSFEEMMRE
jgi:hypothetical protein